MAKVFDEVLNREVEVQEDVTPEVGKEILLEDPEEFLEVIGEVKQ